ncbi:MAG: ABC transporter permease [Bacteroidota bacterium]|nr:ABC transporter permease [Bacteroidota bacterium]
MMLKTNLKIAWRNLIKDKQFTLLNVLGLSAGLACALLIFLWVKDERSYDKFFANDNRLYKLMEKRDYNGDITYSEESSGELSDAVKRTFPEVEYAAAVAPPGWFAQNTLSVGEKNLKASGQYAEKDYFNIFSFPLLEGESNQVLANKNSIVLSDELAMKLFGTTNNLVGKPVVFDHDTTFYVSGVFKKMPANSSQQFDFVLSFDYFRTVKDWVTQWGNTGPLNFILLKPNVNISTFNKKIKDIVQRNEPSDTTRKVIAMRFSDIYLHNNYNGNSQSGARIEYVNLFTLLAIFILVIACINFMNLSTAKAARRFKEVGIKKVVGAGRKELILQFLTESFLLTLVGMLFAIVFAILLLPAFNKITDKSIALHFTPQMILDLWVITLITGIVAGSYPALYLSKFNPLSILKGKLNTSAAELLSRKGLVVFQFCLSTILIIAVIIIYQQIQFIENADPGFNKNNILRIPAEGNLLTNQATFIEDLKQITGVNNASATNHRMVGHNYADYGFSWPGEDPNSQVLFEGFGVTYGFTETMDMHIIKGRSFSKSYGADSTNVIINEAGLKAMHMGEDAVGKTIMHFGKPVQIIGELKDFHFESMHDAIKPAYLFLVPEGGTIVASIQAKNQQATLKAIRQLYEKFHPGFPFTYNFLDEAYQKQYDSETRVSVLSKYFAGLAIIISCLGLFGLAAFTAQKRRKEIGVRKVVGASARQITVLLSMEFLKLVGIALLIAFPASWWIMNSWLRSFAYRVNLSSATFLITALVVVGITVSTISYQSIKAAMANPVRSLRTE